MSENTPHWDKIFPNILFELLDAVYPSPTNVALGDTWRYLLESGICGETTVKFVFQVTTPSDFRPEAIPGLEIMAEFTPIFFARGTIQTLAGLAADPNVLRIYR